MVYDKHIFICINERKNSERLSCGEAHGMELVAAFKTGIKSRNLTLKLRAQKAGCLDICDFGPTMVVYPEGVFYVGVAVSDVDEIIDEHIINNRPVERLLLRKDFKK
jgi:(2Fe-2S) ferredoxin